MLAQSIRDCVKDLGKNFRNGLTSQLVSATTKLPGCALMLTRTQFIQARKSAAPTKRKKTVSSKKDKIRISIFLSVRQKLQSIATNQRNRSKR